MGFRAEQDLLRPRLNGTGNVQGWLA